MWALDLIVCRAYPTSPISTGKAADRPLRNYYLGDLDPSGKDIPRVILDSEARPHHYLTAPEDGPPRRRPAFPDVYAEGDIDQLAATMADVLGEEDDA